MVIESEVKREEEENAKKKEMNKRGNLLAVVSAF
jgi:hypothetical protein